jgi:hypothetical protein
MSERLKVIEATAIAQVCFERFLSFLISLV